MPHLPALSNLYLQSLAITLGQSHFSKVRVGMWNLVGFLLKKTSGMYCGCRRAVVIEISPEKYKNVKQYFVATLQMVVNKS
jgi:hypothetical protein